MSVAAVSEYLSRFGLADRVQVLEQSTATVAEAAAALGVAPEHIAKTVSLYGPERREAILVVTAGDARIDSGAFKRHFGHKANMVKFDEVENLTGHAVGGVCPFAVAPGATVVLDESLRRFDVVYPAAGATNAAARIAVSELEAVLPSAEWVDVCRGWREEPASA